ncbi:MAG: RHS repeat-associated core domain-containing protein [Bacteroidia bacterium]|nr:RHS repeat-associated core domain-containing protein [Bacteroidia bacterium]
MGKIYACPEGTRRDAAGTKLRQKVFGNGGSATTVETDYIGPFHYEDADGDGSGATTAILFFSHEEGRVRRAGNELVYEWFLKDHLGNVRVMFADMNGDGGVDPNPVNGEVLQVDHYYPFGLRMAGLSLVPAVKNSYLFTGKEIQDELSLGWIDFGARMYDAAAGRWNGVDALGEKYTAWSPYNYVMGSPLILTDPTGNDPHYDWNVGVYREEDGSIVNWDYVQSWIDNQGVSFKPDAVGFNIEAGVNVSIPGATGASKMGISFVFFQRGAYKGEWFQYAYLGWAIGIDFTKESFPRISDISQASITSASLKLADLLGANANLTVSPFWANYNGSPEEITPESWTKWFISSSVSVNGKLGVGGSLGGSYFIGATEEEALYNPVALVPNTENRWDGKSGDISIGAGTPGLSIILKYASYYWLVDKNYLMPTYYTLTDKSKVLFKSGAGYRDVVRKWEKQRFK